MKEDKVSDLLAKSRLTSSKPVVSFVSEGGFLEILFAEDRKQKLRN